MILWIETVALCLVFWGLCWLGTGTDKKNIKSLASYPDPVQQIVHRDPKLQKLVPQRRFISSWVSFLSNILIFSLIFLLLGLPVRQEKFGDNFLSILISGQILNAFDFLVIDLLWWRNSRRIRFTGTKDRPELYRSPKKHAVSFFRGIAAFLAVAVVDGLILTLL